MMHMSESELTTLVDWDYNAFVQFMADYSEAFNETEEES